MMLYHNGTAQLLLLLLLLHALHQAQDCPISECSVHLQPREATTSLGEYLYQDLMRLLAVIQRLQSQLLQQQEKLEWEKQRGHQLHASINDRKFVCLRLSDGPQVVQNGLQLAKELEDEKRLGLQLDKQLEIEKNHSSQLSECLEEAREYGRQMAEELENEKKRRLQLDEQLETEKKHGLQLAEELKRKKKQEFELFEKLESEKEQRLQLAEKLVEKDKYDLQMAENLQKETQLRSHLIRKLNEDTKSRLHLAKSLEKEMEHYLMQLATLLQIENRVKLTENLENVRNRCLNMSIDLMKEREKVIDLTKDLERQKRQRLLVAERRRRGALLRADRLRQLGDQQSAEMRLCALIVELLLEKEKNRCLEPELRLQIEKLRAAELEHR
jgi:hypothetical protein